MRLVCSCLVVMLIGVASADSLPDQSPMTLPQCEQQQPSKTGGKASPCAQEQGPGKARALSGNQLESLYLESPQLLRNAEQKNGIEAATKNSLYSSPDQLFHERLMHDQLTEKGPNSVPPPKPNPPLPFLILSPVGTPNSSM